MNETYYLNCPTNVTRSYNYTCPYTVTSLESYVSNTMDYIFQKDQTCQFNSMNNYMTYYQCITNIHTLTSTSTSSSMTQMLQSSSNVITYYGNNEIMKYIAFSNEFIDETLIIEIIHTNIVISASMSLLVIITIIGLFYYFLSDKKIRQQKQTDKQTNIHKKKYLQKQNEKFNEKFNENENEKSNEISIENSIENSFNHSIENENINETNNNSELNETQKQNEKIIEYFDSLLPIELKFNDSQHWYSIYYIKFLQEHPYVRLFVSQKYILKQIELMNNQTKNETNNQTNNKLYNKTNNLNENNTENPNYTNKQTFYWLQLTFNLINYLFLTFLFIYYLIIKNIYCNEFLNIENCKYNHLNALLLNLNSLNNNNNYNNNNNNICEWNYNKSNNNCEFNQNIIQNPYFTLFILIIITTLIIPLNYYINFLLKRINDSFNRYLMHKKHRIYTTNYNENENENNNHTNDNNTNKHTTNNENIF